METPEQHDQRVRRDLALLSYPRRDWLEPKTNTDGAPIHDVVIVGGGQGGLVTAAALKRERVDRVLVLDDNPSDLAGPWLNFARMITLRTPKYLTGPDLGVPSLTIQAWWEARHGEGSWESLGLIPKTAWAEYLAWYRNILELPVRPDTAVHRVRWSERDNCLAIDALHGPHKLSETHLARRVVLATGIDGSGAWDVPAVVRNSLEKHRWAHTREDIDFGALRSKRIAVLGAGASAFDNAATALEHGASEVKLLFRREKLVNVNAYRWAEFVGFLKHLGDLPDEDKWHFISTIVKMGQLPPVDTLRRAQSLPGFSLHPGSPWERFEDTPDGVRITTPKGTHTVDYVIVGTGFVTDLSRRPELCELWPHIALWRDRYTPPEDQRHADLERHPYLGPSFEFTEKNPGTTPWISRVYNYTFGCLPSLGFGGASISGMKYSVQRLTAGITRSLFIEDREAHLASLLSFDEQEF